MSAIGYQAWQIVAAIVQAERVAVVPWPTREAAFSGGAVQSTPASNTSAMIITPSPATSAFSGINVTVETTPKAGATNTPVPTQTPNSSGDPEPTNDPEPAQSAEPTVTSTPQLAQGSGDTSHFSVLRDILDAGTGDGDPALDPIWGGRTSLNILVIGVDRRADGGDQNADVIIVAHVDMVKRSVAAVSLPRDLLVEIPGIGPDKINGSYNFGVLENPDNAAAGVAKVRDTIETVFGVPLDGYVLIDFDGFKEVVDSAGGVTIDVPYDIEDLEYPTEDYGTEVVKFEQGIQHMDGETALKYVRTRHADSDDARRERQYQVLLALFDTGKSVSSITKADQMIVALGQSVQTSFPIDQQLTLARVGLEINQTDIRLSVLGPPILVGGYAEDGKWVYTGDLATIVAFVQEALVTDPSPQSAENTTIEGAGS